MPASSFRGTATPYYTGETVEEGQAHVYFNYQQRPLNPVAVGSYPANPWGLQNMMGNVPEWCSDWKGAYPEGKTIDPTGPDDGVYRVIRGGSWRTQLRSCRSAYRDSFPPNHYAGHIGIGFRVVLVSSPR